MCRSRSSKKAMRSVDHAAHVKGRAHESVSFYDYAEFDDELAFGINNAAPLPTAEVLFKNQMIKQYERNIKGILASCFQINHSPR